MPALAFTLLNAVAFVGVTVIPMDSGRVLPDHTVLVEGERIVAVGLEARVAVPRGARVVPGAGKFLIPGLVDAHVHIPPEGSDPASAEREFRLFLAHGVTTVRVMIGQPEHLALREAVARGELVGPTLYVASPPLGVRAGSLPGVPAIESADDARRFALEAGRAGYDGVKVLDRMTRPEYEALLAGAREAGLPVWGHVPDAVGLSRALEARQDSIEHLAGFVEALIPDESPLKTQQVVRLEDALAAVDESRLAALVAATQAAGVPHVPTLDFWRALVNAESAEELARRPGLEYVPARTLEEWSAQQRKSRERNARPRDAVDRYHALRARITKALHEGGVPVLLGTDSPDVWNVAGVSAVEELKLLVAAGLSPRDALRAATRGPAQLLKGDSQFGAVAPGLRADLVLLDADPLAEVGRLSRPAAVMARGRLFSAAELEGWRRELAADARRDR